MATVLPPPSKRQKIAADEERKENEKKNKIPQDLGNVRIQFIDQSTGYATGGPVTLPVAQTSVKNLELLLNSLKGQVCKCYGFDKSVCCVLETDSRRMRAIKYPTDSPFSP